MSSSSATNQPKVELLVGEDSVIEDNETLMSNIDDDVVLQDDELEVEDKQDNVIIPEETNQPSTTRNYPIQGEMERRAEERLLDERIRERYQREIGDIFAKRSE